MDFNSYIQHPDLLSRETLYALRNYVALYPCNQVARLLMLQNLFFLHDPTFDEELNRAAFFITDHNTLFNLAEAKYHKPVTYDKPVAKIEPKEAEMLINNFLSTIPEEDAEHKPIIVDATQDYMAYVMSHREEQQKAKAESKSSNVSSIIDSFLENERGKITIPDSQEGDTNAPHINVTLENDKDDLQEGFYTEGLAKVYVKQGNYSKALEIIKRLNLNNSEKTTYFADQMRFLEKVIAIRKQK